MRTKKDPEYPPSMTVRVLVNRTRSALSALAVDSILSSVLVVAQIVAEPSEPVSAVAILPVVFRRRFPRTAALAMALVLAVGEIVAAQEAGDSFLPIVAAILIVLYSVAAYERSLPWAIAAGLVLLAGARTDLILNGFGTDTFWPFTILYMGGAWLAGRVVFQRRVDAEDLTAEARALREEQDIRTSRAVAEERDRLARELHDVIAHHVSLMVVQAGAAEQVLQRDPDQAGEALRRIQEAGRETVTELRRLLGILRSGDPGLDTSPQPSLRSVDKLVDQFRQSGLAVDLAVEGDVRPLPLSLDLSAYRIVQEALTNVLRHAGALRTTVSVRYLSRGLELEIIDDGRGSNQNGRWGHGLLGIRERVSLFDGTMEAGNGPEGGFILRTFLPNGARTE